MNLGGLIFLIFIIVASVAGIAMFASQNRAPVQDTFGNYAGNQTNVSQGLVQNATPVATTSGTAVAVIVAIIIFVVAAVGMVAILTHRGNSYSRSYR